MEDLSSPEDYIDVTGELFILEELGQDSDRELYGNVITGWRGGSITGLAGLRRGALVVQWLAHLLGMQETKRYDLM